MTSDQKPKIPAWIVFIALLLLAGVPLYLYVKSTEDVREENKFLKLKIENQEDKERAVNKVNQLQGQLQKAQDQITKGQKEVSEYSTQILTLTSKLESGRMTKSELLEVTKKLNKITESRDSALLAIDKYRDDVEKLRHDAGLLIDALRESRDSIVMLTRHTMNAQFIDVKHWDGKNYKTEERNWKKVHDVTITGELSRLPAADEIVYCSSVAFSQDYRITVNNEGRFNLSIKSDKREFYDRLEDAAKLNGYNIIFRMKFPMDDQRDTTISIGGYRKS